MTKCKAHSENQAYPGENSDDGRTGPDMGRLCDCGFLSYSSRQYGNHFRMPHHKKFLYDRKKEAYQKYMF